MSVIEENPKIFSIAKDALMDRVYPNIPGEKNDNDSAKQKNSEVDELVLPWNEKHWNIFVTSVSSTVDIWGRLIGAGYSVSLLKHMYETNIPICFVVVAAVFVGYLGKIGLNFG